MASGLRVLAIGYRLAPDHPPPAQEDDAIAACRWLLDNTGAIGGNATSILVGGDSAGAYLALRCALALDADRPVVVGLVLLYPLLHMDART